MKKKPGIFLFLLILLSASCMTMRVRIDFDEEFDFSGLETFHFMERNKPSPTRTGRPGWIRDPLFIKRAEREISAVLSQKGFQMAEAPRRADFLVGIYATARNRAALRPPSYRIGRWGRRWVAPGRVYTYKQGTLIIDIVDRSRQELVWRGVGSGVLDRSDPTRNLLIAAEKVLAEFPPL